MVQRTLHEYFVSQRRREIASRKTAFLDLPFDLRRRIYEYAGLSEGRVIYLNYIAREDECPQKYLGFDLQAVPQQQELSSYSQSVSRFFDGLSWPDIRLDRRCTCVEDPVTYDNPCHCAPLPSQLLYVSRTVSSETTSIFYSESYLTVCRSDLGGLSSLRSLSHKALAWITSLSIRLNVCECLSTDPQCCTARWHSPGCHPSCRERGHEKLLRKAVSRQEKSAMTEWKRLCSQMATYITPSRLKLCVICDVGDFAVAKEIVGPLLQLPILRECAIRLGKAPHQYLLQQLAAATASQATGRSINSLHGSFRFLNLPQEIQLQILGYTDLVTPYDLAWSPNAGLGGITFFEFHAFRVWPTLPIEFKCCERCSDALEACCCWTMHTAVSTTCTCWKMPTSLFSVSHKLREDAMSIFYSKNHFLILPAMGTGCPERSEIFQFLTQLPGNARQCLQSLTWILPYLRDAYPVTGNPMHLDWLEVVDICAREMNLSQLSFTIDMSIHRQSRALDASYSSEMSIVREAAEEWAAGQLIVKTMAKHNGWKNVYVHLNWSSNHPDESVRENGEAMLERQVMGDGYDSVSHGKFDRWHRWNGHDCGWNCKLCDKICGPLY